MMSAVGVMCVSGVVVVRVRVRMHAGVMVGRFPMMADVPVPLGLSGSLGLGRVLVAAGFLAPSLDVRFGIATAFTGLLVEIAPFGIGLFTVGVTRRVLALVAETVRDGAIAVRHVAAMRGVMNPRVVGDVGMVELIEVVDVDV